MARRRKEKAHPILHHFQLEHPLEAKKMRGATFLGHGEFGAVIEHNGDAIKFTLHKQDARVAEILKGRDVPGVVRIKGVRKVGRYYLIRQELLYPLSDTVQELVYMSCFWMRYFELGKLTGIELAARVQPRGKKVRKVATQLVEAVHALRELGIYHLDLDSHNVLRTKDGRVKIIDFGVTRVRKQAACLK